MELKVWVEGIQRVVCGVNEKTTCQDVVYALAHATGKTGRFTLIERWRNSERLLAPGEQPLKVLLKWGDHSNDVQFILQWSPLDSGGKGTSPTKAAGDGPIVTESVGGFKGVPQSYSPSGGISQSNSVPQTNGLSGSSGKKLPYAGVNQRQTPGSSVAPAGKQFSHLNGGTRLPESGSGGIKGAPQRLISSDAIKEGGSSPKMKELSAPPPYREPPNPIGKVSPSVSSPSGINSPKGLPPYREPPPPTMVQQQQSPSQYVVNPYPPSRQTGSGSPVRGGSGSVGSNPNQVISGVSQSFFGSSANSSSSSLINNGGLAGVNSSSSSVSASGGVPSSIDSPRHAHLPSQRGEGFPTNQLPNFSANANASDKSDSPFWHVKEQQQLSNGEVAAPSQNGGKGNTSTPALNHMDSPNSHYKELVRLVNTQREKLTSQQAELTQYDAEIMFWEGKAKEQQRNMEFISKEISRLELISSQNESQVLSLAHLEEESDSVKEESEGLKTELNSLRGDLGRCENELDKCRTRLRRLMDELHTTQTAVSKRQEDWLQREATTLAEVEKLKKELELARRETDAVSDLSGSLDKEVHSLDSNLADKKKQMEQLVSAMKEANLQSLIINPPEEAVDGGVHQRSGSTRRMIGSPRQLENAAPTSKNPHGVWV